MSKSNIEWTEHTWNPIVGCFKVSTGCKNCYAEVMSKRLQNMNPASKKKYAGILDERGNFNGTINFDEKALLEPLKRKKPTMYFMSMSDLFHENVKWEWINKIFAVMALTPHHTYQILTKRPDRMLEYFKTFETSEPPYSSMTANYRVFHQATVISEELNIDKSVEEFTFHKNGFPLPNVWLGTSVENQTQANKRIPFLLKVPAAIRFLSCEPLLDWVKLGKIETIYDSKEYVVNSLKGDWYDRTLIKGNWYNTTSMHENWDEAKVSSLSLTNKIDWVIVGGESGHNARFLHQCHVRRILEDCKESKTPFFFKQWGRLGEEEHGYDNAKPKGGNFFNGKQYLEMPNPKK